MWMFLTYTSSAAFFVGFLTGEGFPIKRRCVKRQKAEKNAVSVIRNMVRPWQAFDVDFYSDFLHLQLILRGVASPIFPPFFIVFFDPDGGG